MRLAFFFTLLLLTAFGCAGPAEKTPSTDGLEKGNNDTITGTAGIAPPPAFDREMAETLAAMYFSDLNREAKYPRFKGLLIAIDTPLPGGPEGAADFRARIDGRIWETPNGDTLTIPYRDTLAFTATWDGVRWTVRVKDP
jgi:hypothetical protein